MRFAALISYVGTRYCGWQTQLTEESGPKPSIQEVFEKTLQSIVSEKGSVVASGRTDAGVHALGQVVHFKLTEREWDPYVLVKALNARLPVSIRVRAVQKVSEDFHAQRSAVKKQYSYYFQQGAGSLPHLYPYSVWIYRKLDVRAMNQAVQALVGEHDVKPFGARGMKPGKSTVREIFEAEVSSEPIPFPAGVLSADGHWHMVRIRVVGSGFLKQMVRGIAGTLLQVGEGKRDASALSEILHTQNRSLVGPTAPPRGLWLDRVWYDELDWE